MTNDANVRPSSFVLGPEKWKISIMTIRNAQVILPLIDLARCTGCGVCVQRCPTDAVAVHEHKAAIDRPQACTYCDLCETYCPEGAIGRPFTVVFASEAA
jgi:NAD-dependent dihydropyrimidine dehydrogenase PreA subunit